MNRLFPERLDGLAVPFWLPSARPPAMHPDDFTVVTGYFDIGRGDWGGAIGDRPIPAWLRRSNDDYLAYFRHLARLRNEMIVFTEPRFAERVLAARKAHGLESATVIMTLDRPLATEPVLAATRARIAAAMRKRLTGFVAEPAKPEAWSPDYVLVTALKPVFATAALDLGLVTRPQLAWLDFGYCRDPDSFDPGYPWRYACGDRLHLFILEIPDGRPVEEMVRTAYCPFHGAQVFGKTILWHRFRDLFEAALAELLALDLADDDQGLLMMAWRAAPDLFELHAVPRRDRFCALRLFNEALPRDQAAAAARRARRSPGERILGELGRLKRRLGVS